MWNGREEDRAMSGCPFCDTDFFGGDKMTADEIVASVLRLMPPPGLVTISGGEPALQLDLDLVRCLTLAGYSCAIETNGTVAIDPFLQSMIHVTCSPKVPIEQMKLKTCDDLKVLHPHPNKAITPESFANFPAKRRYIQPVNDIHQINDQNMKSSTQKALMMDGQWGLSVQLHKLVGVE
jgi:organic radical activating enzyme